MRVAVWRSWRRGLELVKRTGGDHGRGAEPSPEMSAGSGTAPPGETPGKPERGQQRAEARVVQRRHRAADGIKGEEECNIGPAERGRDNGAQGKDRGRRQAQRPSCGRRGAGKSESD